jgi:hypothetical protein
MLQVEVVDLRARGTGHLQPEPGVAGRVRVVYRRSDQRLGAVRLDDADAMDAG